MSNLVSGQCVRGFRSRSHWPALFFFRGAFPLRVNGTIDRRIQGTVERVFQLATAARNRCRKLFPRQAGAITRPPLAFIDK